MTGSASMSGSGLNVCVSQRNVAARRSLPGRLHRRLDARPEAVSPVEHRDLRRTVQRRLNADGAARAAASEQDDALAGHLHPVPPQILRVAEAVGVVPGEHTVVVDHGVHRADGSGRRGDAVEERDDRGLARHRDVRAAHVQQPYGGYRAFNLLRRNVEGQIGVVEIEFLKTVIVHLRGFGVRDRRADESEHRGRSGDLQATFLLYLGCI